ncbi:MAG: hypothetical protein ACOX3U_01350 [Christensenellales bacterium]|jgi:hypothetical protein
MKKIVILIAILAVLAGAFVYLPYSLFVYDFIIDKFGNYSCVMNSDDDEASFNYAYNKNKSSFSMSGSLEEGEEEEDFISIYYETAGDKKYIYLNFVGDDWIRGQIGDNVELYDYDIINTDELFDFRNYEFDRKMKRFVLKEDVEIINIMGLNVDYKSCYYKNYLYKVVFVVELEDDDESFIYYITYNKFFFTKITLPEEYTDSDDFLNDLIDE